MKFITSFLMLFSFSLGASIAQINHKPNKDLLKIIDANFADAAAQYKLLAKNLPAGKFPKTYFPTTGKYEFSNSGWWCSGFYPALYSIYITKQMIPLCTMKQSAYWKSLK